MLDDLFGIQARGGCSCAGPYGHRLLGIGPGRSRALGEQAGRGYLGIKPGWARLSFNYFISDTVAGFLVEAVDLLAAGPVAGPATGDGPSWLPPELERLRDCSLPPQPA
jgi:selenocysteine lyase/cysteine desulfurase